MDGKVNVEGKHFQGTTLNLSNFSLRRTSQANFFNSNDKRRRTLKQKKIEDRLKKLSSSIVLKIPFRILFYNTLSPGLSLGV